MIVASWTRTLAAGFAGAALLATAAWAHHGWDWAEEGQIELNGTIREIYIGPPHPTLQIETAEHGTWTVELGNPRATERAGFVEGVAEVGDAIVAIGNRSLDPEERRMKAVRIIVGGETFDIYPERIREG